MLQFIKKTKTNFIWVYFWINGADTETAQLLVNLSNRYPSNANFTVSITCAVYFYS